MKVATWNVNGIRARFEDVTAWSEANAPDVFCLQEIKAAPSQVPEPLTGLPRYHNHWHGGPGGYSGVSLHLRRDTVGPATIEIPDFDEEHRIVTARLDTGLVVASVYVHNGGKGIEPKIRFLTALREWVQARHAAGERVLLCGDLNVTRTDADLHPKHHKRGGLGQSKRERDLLQALLDEGLIDTLRHFEPDDDSLFTWFPPWRDEKQKNRGWRIDYVLASEALEPNLSSYAIQDEGTSDHIPYLVELR